MQNRNIIFSGKTATIKSGGENGLCVFQTFCTSTGRWETAYGKVTNAIHNV